MNNSYILVKLLLSLLLVTESIAFGNVAAISPDLHGLILPEFVKMLFESGLSVCQFLSSLNDRTEVKVERICLFSPISLKLLYRVVSKVAKTRFKFFFYFIKKQL